MAEHDFTGTKSGAKMMYIVSGVAPSECLKKPKSKTSLAHFMSRLTVIYIFFEIIWQVLTKLSVLSESDMSSFL